MSQLKLSAAITLAVLAACSSFAFAQTTSSAFIQARIQTLRSEVQSLEQQLLSTRNSTWCHTFNTDLHVGDAGFEVGELQIALASTEGTNAYPTEIFDERTDATVAAFQEKYANVILAPYGLQKGTGYVGKTTRALLNAFYECPAGGVLTQPVGGAVSQ